MNHRLDSAQALAFFGTTGGFILSHYDRILAAACAAVGIAYTLWKWRQEAKVAGKRGR